MASLLLVDGAIPAGAAGSELVMVTLATQNLFRFFVSIGLFFKSIV